MGRSWSGPSTSSRPDAGCLLVLAMVAAFPVGIALGSAVGWLASQAVPL